MCFPFFLKGKWFLPKAPLMEILFYTPYQTKQRKIKGNGKLVFMENILHPTKRSLSWPNSFLNLASLRDLDTSDVTSMRPCIWCWDLNKASQINIQLTHNTLENEINVYNVDKMTKRSWWNCTYFMSFSWIHTVLVCLIIY